MSFSTQLTAVIQCDHEHGGRGCVVTEKYSVDAESVSPETFSEDAREHFESHGWQLYGGTRCRNHVRAKVAL